MLPCAPRSVVTMVVVPPATALMDVKCRVAGVPRGYGEGVAEENVVIAVLLSVGETRRAIATGGAGSKVARPDLGELEAVLPADHSRLAGELAGLARAVDAGAFGHCVADLEMECNACIRERLLHHGKRIVALRVRRGEQILLVGIAGAVAEDAAAHVVELNEQVFLAGFCTGQADPFSGLHVVVAGLAAVEIGRGRASLPGIENSIVVGVVDSRAENDRGIGSAGIERRVVLVGLAERSRIGGVVPAGGVDKEVRDFCIGVPSADRIVESLHILRRRGWRDRRTVVDHDGLEGEVGRQDAIDDDEAGALGEQYAICAACRQRDGEAAAAGADAVCAVLEVGVYVGAIDAQGSVDRSVRVCVGQVAADLLTGDGIAEEGCVAAGRRWRTLHRCPIQEAIDEVSAGGNAGLPGPVLPREC